MNAVAFLPVSIGTHRYRYLVRNRGFPKAVVVFYVFSFALFFGGQKIFFVSCVVGFYRSQSQRIAAQASQKFNMCDFVASSQAFAVKAGIACDHWCPYIMRHRAPLCFLLTRVWKPGFRNGTVCHIWSLKHLESRH